MERVNHISDDDRPVGLLADVNSMRGIRREGLPPGIIHGHEVSGDHGVHRARGDDASRGRVHDRVAGGDDARGPARVIHVGVAQVDPSGVERAARVRVHVVPGDGHIVDGAVRRDAEDPFEVRIHGDVVRLDMNVAGSGADRDAVRMLGILDGVVPDRDVLRAHGGRPVAELDALPLVRADEVRDPHVLDDDVGVGRFDPEHRLGGRVRSPVDEPVPDDVRVRGRSGAAAYSVHRGEPSVRGDRNRAARLQRRGVCQAVTGGRSPSRALQVEDQDALTLHRAESGRILDLQFHQVRAGRGEGVLCGERRGEAGVPGAVPFPIPAGLEGRGGIRVG